MEELQSSQLRLYNLLARFSYCADSNFREWVDGGGIRDYWSFWCHYWLMENIATEEENMAQEEEEEEEEDAKVAEQEADTEELGNQKVHHSFWPQPLPPPPLFCKYLEVKTWRRKWGSQV